LEPEKGVYNFDLIQSDLEFLEDNGKNLFIQVQDVSFDTIKYKRTQVYIGGSNLPWWRGDTYWPY